MICLGYTRKPTFLFNEYHNKYSQKMLAENTFVIFCVDFKFFFLVEAFLGFRMIKLLTLSQPESQSNGEWVCKSVITFCFTFFFKERKKGAKYPRPSFSKFSNCLNISAFLCFAYSIFIDWKSTVVIQLSCIYPGYEEVTRSYCISSRRVRWGWGGKTLIVVLIRSSREWIVS